jgi:hypothetical protein
MKKNNDSNSTGTPFLAARCSAELRANAEAAAKERGWNLGTLVREAVEQYVSSTVPPVEDSHRKVDGRSRSWLRK